VRDDPVPQPVVDGSEFQLLQIPEATFDVGECLVAAGDVLGGDRGVGGAQQELPVELGLLDDLAAVDPQQPGGRDTRGLRARIALQNRRRRSNTSTTPNPPTRCLPAAQLRFGGPRLPFKILGGTTRGGSKSITFDGEYAPTTAPALPQDLSWYDREPLWRALAEGRLRSGMTRLLWVRSAL
jgi:hypothetical protein